MDKIKVYILIFDDRVERVSCDKQKIDDLVYESNGYDENGNMFAGPYFSIAMDLEDADLIIK